MIHVADKKKGMPTTYLRTVIKKFCAVSTLKQEPFVFGDLGQLLSQLFDLPQILPVS